ncbi:hypothetical protein PGQ11_002567 [Apiospora arundinis]|uniref:Uncharacterized protein n=1 Tax=Apiospora arundinis TaxID=335852 RepID=A0ABR2JII1_9PEZI
MAPSGCWNPSSRTRPVLNASSSHPPRRPYWTPASPQKST